MVKLRDILLKFFITNITKKLLDLSWKCYQALFSVVEKLKSMPNLMNVANLFNIKVKQEFELIMLDTEVIHVNIFTNEPIKIVV